MSTIVISIDHEIGDIVYLITDPVQDMYMVVGYNVDEHLQVRYYLRREAEREVVAGAVELSREKQY